VRVGGREAATRRPRNGSERVWLALWRFFIRYHRYEVQGLDVLLRSRPMLVAGYHGRPAAWDLCMLTVVVFDRLGYIPHGVFHSGLMHGPVGRMLRGIGGVSGDDGTLAEAVRRGEHILVTPGGAREGTRSFLDRYRVEWGDRSGYVRLAIRYRLPIVPAGASGVDDTFIGLNWGYETSRRLGIPPNFPVWFGVGPFGLSPFSLPFPVRIRTVLGEPIEDPTDPRVHERDEDAVAAIHQKTVAAVQEILDRANRRRR